MTNLNIAKLYLATMTTATTATQIDTAITDGSANTAVQALSTAAFVEAAYQAAFGRAADAEGAAYWADQIDNQGMAKDDAFMTALNYGATVYVAPTADAPLVIGGVTFTAATVSATDDVVVAANKAAAEAAASTATAGSVAAAVVTVTEVASTVTVATETIDNGEYAAAATAYDAAVATAAASSAAATAAAATVSSVALATASSTAAATAKTDADLVVTAATALVAAATATVSAADDITAATTATTAAAAQTVAATAVTTAATAVTAATAAAAAAAATGTTFTLTTSTDTIFGTAKSDIITADQTTLASADKVIDSSSVDSDTFTISATSDIATTSTVIGIEDININLNAVSDADNTFTVAANNISEGTINLDNVKAGSLIVNTATTAVSNNATVTHADDFTGDVDVQAAIDANVNVEAAGNAVEVSVTSAGAGTANENATITLTGATAFVDNVAATGDLTVTASGDLGISNDAGAAATLASTTTTLTVGGNLVVNETSANAAATAFSADVTGVATITSLLDSGSLSVTAGGMIYATAITNIDGALTLETTADDITNDVANSAGVTATSASSLVASTLDGYINIADVDSAATVSLSATEAVTLTTAAAAQTITVHAANTYTVAGVLSTNSELISATAAGATYDVTLNASGNGERLLVDADSLVALKTVNVSGDQDVTVQVDVDNIEALEALATPKTLTVTDTSTAGTTTLALAGASTGLDAALSIDLSAVNVDQILLTLTDVTDATHGIKVASGATVSVDSAQDGLFITADAASAATNTLTINILDDDTTATVETTSYITDAIKTTNFNTVTLDLQDEDATTALVTAIDVATSELVITGAGNMTAGTSITAGSVDGSAATGDLAIALVNTIATDFTTGSGNDTFTDDATGAAYTLDGGAGVDTFVTGAVDYSGFALSLSNIEKIDVTADTGGAGAAAVIFSAAQMTGKNYIFVATANAGTEAVAINGTVAAGETINLSNVAADVQVDEILVTGNAGNDIITTSSTFGTGVDAGDGADNVTGGAGDDTIDGQAGADTIIGGAGDDAITGGTGTDTMTGGNDNDTFIVDVVADATTIEVTTITDFTAGTATATNNVDSISISEADIEALTAVTMLIDGTAGGAGGAVAGGVDATVIQEISADATAGATANVFVLTGETFADTDAVEDALETGAFEITLAGAPVAKDAITIVYSDGTDTYVAFAATAGTTADFAEADLTVENLVKLSGISSIEAGDFVAGNFDFIA